MPSARPSLSSPTPTPRQQYWLDLFADWQARGGGSLKALAAEHDLPIDAIYSARRRLRQAGLLAPGYRKAPTASAPRLVPVRLAAPPPPPVPCRVHLPNGVVVELPATGSHDLPALLTTLAALP